MKRIILIYILSMVSWLQASQFLLYSEIVESVGESIIAQYDSGHVNLDVVEQNQIVAVHFFVKDIVDFDGFECDLIFPTHYLEFQSYATHTDQLANVFTVPVSIHLAEQDTLTLALTSGGIENNTISGNDAAYLGVAYFKALQSQPRGIQLSGLVYVDNSAELYSFIQADTAASFGGGPLPVVLSAFSGEWLDDEIQLIWQTESEYNALGFHVLRSQQEKEGYEQVNTRIINTVSDVRFPHHYSYFDKNVLANVNYFYKLVQVDKGGHSKLYGPVKILAKATSTANIFQLYQNYPNPFNSRTVIRYSLSHDGNINLKIVNINGQVVKTLKSGFSQAGEYLISWNGTDNAGMSVTSGIYWCRLESKENIKNKKIAYLQ